MKTRNQDKLFQKLSVGRVYRRQVLANLTTAVDRDLASLLMGGLLQKVAPGLYYKPKTSRYGLLPPGDNELVKAFLGNNDFLLYSWDQYNALGVGLTQLYNRVVVYNRKRHGLFELSHREYDFRRPARGYPRKLTPEFLLIDLMNNLNELEEDPELIKKNIKNKLPSFNKPKLMWNARKYGKVRVLRFFEKLSNE